jgi:hypothetical protein
MKEGNLMGRSKIVEANRTSGAEGYIRTRVVGAKRVFQQWQASWEKFNVSQMTVIHK